jgi:glycerol-3-phosphate dehydrogenase (NAD(P)+)
LSVFIVLFLSVINDTEKTYEKITVYGLGNFGLAMMSHIDRAVGDEVELSAYARGCNTVDYIREHGRHPDKFPDYELPSRFQVTSDSSESIKDADLVVLAIPSAATRIVIDEIAGSLKPGATLLNTSKALDVHTGRRLSEVYGKKLNGFDYDYALLAGGTIDKDLFDRQPLGADVASKRLIVAQNISRLLSTPSLSVTPTNDLVGVEFASAMKNVVSVISGFVQGREYDQGTMTYTISKTAGSIGRACVALGAKERTFAIDSQCWGNDMWMSSIGGKTRNQQFGIRLGQGEPVAQALQAMKKEGKTVESVSTVTSLGLYPTIMEVSPVKALHDFIVRGSIDGDEFARRLFSYL